MHFVLITQFTHPKNIKNTKILVLFGLMTTRLNKFYTTNNKIVPYLFS